MAKKTQPIHIPDIPAQISDEEISETIVETPESLVVIHDEPSTEEAVDHKTEMKESDEILFLRSVLQKQHNGGFGRHLDEMIYNRIKELKAQ